MKKYLFIALTFWFTSTCFAKEPMDIKIDASSEKVLEQSLNELKDKLTEEQASEFADALLTVYMNRAVPVLFGEQSDEADAQKIGREVLHGKSPNEIISDYKKLKEKGISVLDFTTQSSSKASTKEKTPAAEKGLVKIKIGESITINDLKITIKKLEHSKLIVDEKGFAYRKAPTDVFLQVKIGMENTSEGKILHLQDVWERSLLTDNFDNIYDPEDLSDYYNIKNFIRSERIKPGQSLSDIIAFPLPLENAKTFTLTLDPVIYKPMGHEKLKRISDTKFEIDFSKEDIK